MDANSPKTSALYAIHKQIAVDCHKENKAYLACKDEHADPAKCLEQGKAVMTCVQDLLTSLKNATGKKLTDYCDCLDYYSLKFEKCQKEREAFEQALKDQKQ